MPSNFLETPQHIDLFQKGYDSSGQSPLKFSGSEVNKKAQTYFEAGVPSNFIQDGDLIIRLNVVDGYLQSEDYVEGVSGWILKPNNVEFGTGFFRGDISAASGVFGNLKLNASDSPNALIVNDNYNDRVLLGYLKDGF